jgi:hypothetical protein
MGRVGTVGTVLKVARGYRELRTRLPIQGQALWHWVRFPVFPFFSLAAQDRRLFTKKDLLTQVVNPKLPIVSTSFLYQVITVV